MLNVINNTNGNWVPRSIIHTRNDQNASKRKFQEKKRYCLLVVLKVDKKIVNDWPKKKFKRSKVKVADVSAAPILRAPFSLPFHRIFPNIIFYAYIAAGKNPFPLLFLQENQQLVSICFSLLVLSLGRSKGQRKRREARWQHVGNEAKIFFTKEILVIKKAANDAEEWNIGRQHRRR